MEDDLLAVVEVGSYALLLPASYSSLGPDVNMGGGAQLPPCRTLHHKAEPQAFGDRTILNAQ